MIDTSTTTVQTNTFNHSMLRTPDISETSLSLNNVAAAFPNVDFLMVTSITAAQVEAKLNLTSTSTTPTVKELGVQIKS